MGFSPLLIDIKDASGTFLIRHSVRENSYVLGLLDDKNELKNYVIKRSVSKIGFCVWFRNR